jgi:hypothetical protein
MALFIECMPSCAQIVLDTADIVRDGDGTPVGEADLLPFVLKSFPHMGKFLFGECGVESF